MADPWASFQFDLIMTEARARLAENINSTAAAMTAEKRTLEYWIAHVAHANAVAAFEDEFRSELGT